MEVSSNLDHKMSPERPNNDAGCLLCVKITLLIFHVIFVIIISIILLLFIMAGVVIATANNQEQTKNYEDFREKNIIILLIIQKLAYLQTAWEFSSWFWSLLC